MILRYGGKYSNARQQCPDGPHECLHALCPGPTLTRCQVSHMHN